MSKLSSTAIQRFAHQLSPNPPRFDCALIPPFACRGRDGGKYASSHHDPGHRRSSDVPSPIPPAPLRAARTGRAARRSRARSARPRRCRRPRRRPPSCCSIISSIFSSSVPRRRTCGPARCRVWPMRKARSVAWFSTAGFHQRSKWKTWFARGQVQAGAARLERQHEDRRRVAVRSGTARPSGRAAPCGTPPCRNSTSRPNVSCRCRCSSVAHLGELGEDQRAVAGRQRPPPASRSAAPACPSGRRAPSCRRGTAPGGCRPASASMSVASTSPLRWMPSAASSCSAVSSTTAA